MDYKIKTKIRASLGKTYVMLSIVLSLMAVLALTYFIASKGLRTFVNGGINPIDFLLGRQWDPEGYKGAPAFGIGIFLLGSFTIAGCAVLISAPLSVGLAVFMKEIQPKYGRKYMQPVIELLVGIPSVVYGYIGLTVIVPFIRNHFSGLGFSMLAGIIVLAIMILPTITSVAYDSIDAVPNSLRQASYALGATRWQTIRHVLVPAALSNILTGVVLGMARAFGEALAVQMVIGNVQKMPESILSPVSTLTSVLTLEMGNTVSGSIYNDALWSMALVLLLVSFIFIGIIRALGRGMKNEKRKAA